MRAIRTTMLCRPALRTARWTSLRREAVQPCVSWMALAVIGWLIARIENRPQDAPDIMARSSEDRLRMWPRNGDKPLTPRLFCPATGVLDSRALLRNGRTRP